MLHEKSENRKLYYCESAHCRVVTFLPSDHDFCPSCNQIGLLLRGPVTLTDYRARAALHGNAMAVAPDPSPVDPFTVSSAEGQDATAGTGT